MAVHICEVIRMIIRMIIRLTYTHTLQTTTTVQAQQLLVVSQLVWCQSRRMLCRLCVRRLVALSMACFSALPSFANDHKRIGHSAGEAVVIFHIDNMIWTCAYATTGHRNTGQDRTGRRVEHDANAASTCTPAPAAAPGRSPASTACEK